MTNTSKAILGAMVLISINVIVVVLLNAPLQESDDAYHLSKQDWYCTHWKEKAKVRMVRSGVDLIPLRLSSVQCIQYSAESNNDR